MSRMRYGVARALEDEANAILAKSLKGVTSQSDKADILTPWKQKQRLKREVFVGSGVPDPSVRKGMYHRRANLTKPHLNSRDGVALPHSQQQSSRTPRSSLADFVAGMIDPG